MEEALGRTQYYATIGATMALSAETKSGTCNRTCSPRWANKSHQGLEHAPRLLAQSFGGLKADAARSALTPRGGSF